MSDRDLKLLIKIIRFMQGQEKAIPESKHEDDDIDERLSALLNAEISEEDIRDEQPIEVSMSDESTEEKVENVLVEAHSNAENEVFEQLKEENDALKEQVTSMSEMMEMTLKHIDTVFDEKIDKEKESFKEIENGLQEQITAQQDMLQLTLKNVDTAFEERINKEKEGFEKIEQDLQEQITAQQDMLQMTLKNVDIAFEERINKEKEGFEKIEQDLQEQITAQQDMLQMTLKNVDIAFEERINKEKEGFEKIEQDLQEQITSQQDMLQMTLKNVDIVFEEKTSKQQEEFDAKEEVLNEQISSLQQMMEMSMKNMLQNYRSEKEVENIINEYKAIENNLQEAITSQQEMMEMTIKHLQNELTQSENNTESQPNIQLENTEFEQLQGVESQEIKEQSQASLINTEGEKELTMATIENAYPTLLKTGKKDDQTIDVAHKVFVEYLDLSVKLKNTFKGHFVADFMHKGNSRSYLYVRPVRNLTFILLVDSLLEGISSVVFNSLSSMILHQLIVERRIENVADLLNEFTKKAASIYKSIDEEVRDTSISILSVDKSTLEIAFVSTGNELFYAQKDKYRLLKSGKATKQKMNENAYKVNMINGRKGAVMYMCSQPIETVYEKTGGGNFMSLQEMLINTYQLNFTGHKDNLTGYMQELHPENQADNTLIFGLNL